MLNKKHKAIKLAWDLLAPLSSTVRQPPIYLAGMPRSGTTWMAHVLSTAAGIKYFHEPFNPNAFPEAEQHRDKYLRVDDEDEEFAEYCQDVFGPRTYIKSFSRSSSSIHKKVSWWPGRLMIKDVYSLMGLEWIDRQFAPAIAIVIRHPCGLAASWFKLSWKPEKIIDRLLDQPKLIKDYLQPYESLLKEARGNFWSAMGALWGASYYVVLEQKRKERPNWIVVEHEVLCTEPVEEYRKLFKQLDLNWNPATDYLLRASTSNDSGQRYVTARVSSQEPDKWKTILETEQVKLIRGFSEPFGISYYQEDWTINRSNC